MTMPKTGNVNLSYLGSKIFVDDSSIKNLNNSKVRDWLDTPTGNVSLAGSRNIALHLGRTETTRNTPPNKAVQGYDRRAENTSFDGWPDYTKVEFMEKVGRPCYYLYIKNHGYGTSSGSIQPTAVYANVFFKLTDADRTLRVSGNSDRTERHTEGQGVADLKLSVIASDTDYLSGASEYIVTHDLISTSDAPSSITWTYDVPIATSKPYITLSFQNKEVSPGGQSGGATNAPFMGVQIYNVKAELL